MSCYITPIIDFIGRRPSYVISDEKGYIFIPVGNKYKDLKQTYRVANSHINKINRKFAKYGTVAFLESFDDGHATRIQPTKLLKNAMDIKNNQEDIDEYYEQQRAEEKRLREEFEEQYEWSEEKQKYILKEEYGGVDFQPTLRQDLFNGKDEVSDKEILTTISKSEHALASVAKHLIKYSQNIPVVLIAEDSVGKNEITGGTSAARAWGNSKIEIAEFANFKGKNNSPIPTIIHEVIHTLTSNYIADNNLSDTKVEFARLYQEAKNKLAPILGEDYYGLANLDEFVVALFSDAKLIAELEKQESSKPTKFKNLLQEIFDEILKIFNFNKRSNLYQDAFNVASNLIVEQQQYQLLEEQNSAYQSELDEIYNDPEALQRMYEEQQEFASQIEDLELTQEESNQAQELFKNTQSSIDFQPITDFTNVQEKLVDLRNKLEAKFTTWKASEKANSKTTKYKDTWLRYTNAIAELADKIANINISDTQAMYNYMIAEYKEIKNAIDNYQDNAVNNEALMERLALLYSYIVGIDFHDENKNTDTWDFSNFPNFNDELFRPVSDLKLLMNDFNSKRVFELLKSLPMFAEYKKTTGLTDDEFYQEVFIKAGSAKLKDINIAQQYTLGLISNETTIFAEALYDLYHSEIAKARNPIRGLSQRMAELNKELRDNKFDFGLFKEKKENGVDTLLLINLFTHKYSKNTLPQLYKLIKDYNSISDRDTVKKGMAYKEIISWHKTNSEIIDYSKIPSIKAMYSSHSELGKYFVHSDADMLAYEAQLKKTMGKEYNKVLNDSIAKIDNFIVAANSQRIQNPNFYDKFYYENNPFEFVKNYNTTPFNPILINPSTGFSRFNNSKYTEFIPKETTIDVNGNKANTGFYNQTFRDKVMSNDKAYELWEHMIEATKYINSAYIESGQDINLLSWGKINQDLGDFILQNANSKEGLGKIGKAIIDTWKDSWYYSREATDPKKLNDNYYDNSKYEVKTYRDVLVSYDFPRLEVLAKQAGIPFLSRNQVLQGVKPGFEKAALAAYKKELATDIATQEYAKNKSGDIVKITLALMEMAAVQRARVQGVQAAEMLSEKHASITDEFGRRRNKDVDKVESWITTNFYNKDFGRKNAEITAIRKRLNDFEKTLEKVLKGLLSEYKNGQDISFYFNDKTYKRVNNVYTITEKNGNAKPTVTAITEQDFNTNIEDYINSTLKDLGTTMSPDSFLNGMLNQMSKKAFLINPISGLHNRLEGYFTNMINDLTGDFWTPGNNRHSDKFLNFANLLKMAPEKFGLATNKNKFLQLQTLNKLIEEMHVVQDRKNEVDKKDEESTYGNIKKRLNLFALAIDNPEFKNQATIILNMLQDVIVKDNNGNEFPFFDKKGFFTLYEPGTLNLKPEFKNNNQSFENFMFDTSNVNNNAFYVIKERIGDAISQLQGNYSNVDSVKMRHEKGALGVTWGKVLTAFMRWLPAHANQRYGGRKSNIMYGGKKQGGRHKILWDKPFLGAAYTSSVLTVVMGPGSLIFGIPIAIAGIKMIYDKKFLNKQIGHQSNQIRALAGFMQETLVRSIGLPLKMIGIKNINVNNKFLNKLSVQEINGIKAIAQELAIQIALLMMMVLLKALVHGGSDDDDENKMINNFVDNNGNRLINNLAVWSDPTKLISDNTKFALLRTVGNVIKTSSDLYKMSQGDKIDEQRPIMNIIKEQPFLPIPSIVSRAVVKGEYPGYDKKEYQSSQWFDRYTKTEEWKLEQQYKKKRADYKEALTDEIKETFEQGNMSDEVYEEEVDSKARSKMNKKNMKRKENESYEDALKRINFEIDNE